MMKTKLISVFWVFVLMIFVASQALAADASFVVKAVDVLERNYVDPLDRCELFNAAIEGLEKTLKEIRPTVTAEGQAWHHCSFSLNETKLSFKLERVPKYRCSNAQDHFIIEFWRAERLAFGMIDSTRLAFEATRHMAESLKDSHLYFLNPENNLESKKQRIGKNSYAGVGVAIRKDKDSEKNIYISEVFEGSPADGILKPFDRIIAVGDYKVIKETELEKVADLVRGPKDTEVKITVMRYGEPEPIVFSLQRLMVKPPVISSQMLENEVGYVKIHTFNHLGVGLKFASTIDKLEVMGMKALILDLRGNAGGLMSELQEIAGTLLPLRTVLCRTVGRNGYKKDFSTPSISIRFELQPSKEKLPLVILIDGGSASASEVVSSVFQEYGRATVVGMHSAVAVDIAVDFKLPEGAAMRVTIGRIITPNGVALGKVGVTPDVVVPFGPKDYALGRDPQLLRALEIIKSKLK